MPYPILVISPVDNSNVHSFLKEKFGSLPYDFKLCSEVGAAIEIIEGSGAVETILVDCSIEREDCLMNMRLLKSHRLSRHSNIVLLCEWADRKAYVKHPEAWAILRKPFNAMDLESFLNCSSEDYHDRKKLV